MHLLEVGQQVAVRQHRALRLARRAARIRKARKVILTDRHRRRRLTAADHLIPAHRADRRATADHHDVLEHRKRLAQPVHRTQERLGDDNSARLCIGQDERDFVGGVHRVERDHHAAGTFDPEVRIDEMGDVVHEHSHPIALPDTERRDARSGLLDRPLELAVRDGLVLKDERSLVRKASSRLLDDVRDVHARALMLRGTLRARSKRPVPRRRPAPVARSSFEQPSHRRSPPLRPVPSTAR